VVECSRPTFTATAGLDSKGRCKSLYNITETNVLLRDKPRKAYLVGLMFSRVSSVAFCIFLIHSFRFSRVP
jgi:hypothetical protein